MQYQPVLIGCLVTLHESQLKVPDLKAALLALKVPISDFAGLRKPALVQLLVHKRGGPATVSVDSSVDAKRVPRVARARRNREEGRQRRGRRGGGCRRV